ncbi:hypothetical protein BKA64DRAFT_761139 [Cadophora sp. MPI-SDFR-AT-0126]|nr:hypothetical protein BKA64DRAFT_761139 [Leotiomycetes sp. MPI-SDFR-AT-0126]
MSTSGSPSTTRSSPRTPTSPTSSTSIISPATSTSTERSVDALPWILHHALEPQSTCELPISIMFSINSGRSLPQLKDIYSWWQLDRDGKLVLAFLSSQDRIIPSIADSTAADIRTPHDARAEPKFAPTHCPDDRFMDHGNETLLRIGLAHIANNAQKSVGFEPADRPRGLPPHFIRKYCIEQVFIKDFGDVNFDHALTALDYIRDLEFTRRDTLRETAESFGINERNWRNVLGGNPNALAWVELTQANELRIETMYSNLFIDLRIWTMTSILLSKQFYKQEALAMLNTLFPPAIQELPTSKINPKILYQQRAIFYRYVLDVAANGPGIMVEFEKKLNQHDNRHNWLAVRRNMEKYMDLAAKMIDQAKVASGMLRLRRAETLDPSELSTSRSFSGASFDSTRPKTPKSKGSLTDMRVKFGLSKKPSKVFGDGNSAYSKSMVNVSKPNQEKPNQSMMVITSKKFDSSRSTPAVSQPRFDNLLSLRARGVSKPMGFVPPPLDELEEILGRTLSPKPEDYEAEPTTTPNSTTRVSFDFDAELGLGNTYRRPSLSSDLQTSDRPKKAKPTLQIDTKGITSKQQVVSPPVKSARPLPKFQKAEPIPSAVRPQTADSSSGSRNVLRSPASSSKLFSAAGPPPFEPLPPLATLPIKRRQIPEPAMMPEPLNINRPRKPTTPGTSNLSSFPPRNNIKDRASSAQTPANKTPNFNSSSERIDRVSQDRDKSPDIRKIPSHSSATGSRPSTSSEDSSRLSKQISAGPATQRRLPSDNYEFLNRPYSGSSQENNYPSQVIMKKSSFNALFSRKKKSSPALKDDFQAGNALGISTQPTTPTGENPRESGEIKPILKKKSSFAAFMHGNSDDTTDTFTELALPPNTPRSAKATRFQDDLHTLGNENFENGKDNETPQPPKLKQKSSFNFSNPLLSSASRPNMRSERGEIIEKSEPRLKKKSSFAFGGGMHTSESHVKIDSQEQPERGLKKMSSFVFGNPALRNSDSQATLRPEPRVLKKKRSNYAVAEPSTETFQVPQLPALRHQSSFAAVGGPVRPYTANSEVGLFAQFEAEDQGLKYGKSPEDGKRSEIRAEVGVGGPVRPATSGREAGPGAYTRYPVEEESLSGGGEEDSKLSTSFSSSKSPTSPLTREFVPSPSPPTNSPVISGSAAAGPALKKKKSVWGFAKKEMTAEEVAEKEMVKEEKRKAKEEKRERERRELEEGVFAVAEFFGGEVGETERR